jgi:hypothetical protein
MVLNSSFLRSYAIRDRVNWVPEEPFLLPMENVSLRRRFSAGYGWPGIPAL